MVVWDRMLLFVASPVQRNGKSVLMHSCVLFCHACETIAAGHHPLPCISFLFYHSHVLIIINCLSIRVVCLLRIQCHIACIGCDRKFDHWNKSIFFKLSKDRVLNCPRIEFLNCPRIEFLNGSKDRV